MKAIQLTDFTGVDGLALVDIPVPEYSNDEVLIKVKAAGVNYAEVEQIQGRYLTFGKEIPFTMGFEVAGVVESTGNAVSGVRKGDRVTALSPSGGFAEYAVVKADAVIPVPPEMSFADATTIPLQGMTAYTLLKYLVIPYKPQSILIQAAAGGVGVYLVQLAKLFGINTVIGLASSDKKLEIVKSIGADHAINYTKADWTTAIIRATREKGVDVVLQMTVDTIGSESFKLAASGGRIILFGSKNYHDTITTEQVRQLIWQNQTLAGFAFPALPPAHIKESLGEFLEIIRSGKLRIFAKHEYTLHNAKDAFKALQSRATVGKVYLTF